jgi:hypothetical protein
MLRLHNSCNMPALGNKRRYEQALAGLLPENWRVSLRAASSKTDAPDLVIEAPDGRRIAIEAKLVDSIDPRGASDQIRERSNQRGALLVAAPYLTPQTRATLKDAGVGYLDLTGNTFLASDNPGLFILVRGADTDPNWRERPTRSLKGPKAGRVVRYLVDFKTPRGVRKLAGATGVNPGYVSRLLALLDRETLIERDKQGAIERVDWPALLRRWATDAPLSSRGESASFIDPRGIANTAQKLTKTRLKYAITGSAAANRWAPVAPARTLTVYVDDLDRARRVLDLREADHGAGANVILIAPEDGAAYARAVSLAGQVFAAPSQVAADLLTSAGRGPAEADELIRWMAEHEEKWRG